MKRMNQLWAISLVVLGCVSMIQAGSHLLGAELPDTAQRLLGLADLAGLAVLAYTTVRIMVDKREK